MARSKKPAQTAPVTTSVTTTSRLTPARLTFHLQGPNQPWIVSIVDSNALLTGAGSVLNLAPAAGRWHVYANRLRDSGEEADREQLADDWRRVGADLYVALDRYLEDAPEPVISTLYELLLCGGARESGKGTGLGPGRRLPRHQGGGDSTGSA